jgi:hypothetical protein
MRTYAVIGTGAIGGLYGARLQHAGHEVHFLARSDAEWIAENGLVVESVWGDLSLPHVKVHSDVADMPRCDVVLVCLKTTQNHLLSTLLRPVVRAGSDRNVTESVRMSHTGNDAYRRAMPARNPSIEAQDRTRYTAKKLTDWVRIRPGLSSMARIVSFLGQRLESKPWRTLVSWFLDSEFVGRRDGPRARLSRLAASVTRRTRARNFGCMHDRKWLCGCIVTSAIV